MESFRLASPTLTLKPWGQEELITCNTHFAVKDIRMVAGTRTSLQSHQRKIETIYLISGELELETIGSHNEPRHEVFKAGDAYHLGAGVIHRVRVLQDCRLIEVSTPELDDIKRHADDFGRD